MKDAKGKVLVENDQVKEEWRKYMEKLLNEEWYGIVEFNVPLDTV